MFWRLHLLDDLAFHTEHSLPADGVIYVQNYILPNGASAPVVNDGSAPCFNPYQVAQDPTSQPCLEGDAYVEGELQGQLTIASAANIIITRDLTYNCVDGNGAAVSTNPDTVAVCTSPSGGRSPDILGLSANQDVVVAHAIPTDLVTQSDQDCSAVGSATVPARRSEMPAACPQLRC